MNHTITVMLSEAAQRAAILAGEPAARTQTYHVEDILLPRLLALPWTRISDEGEASCIVPPTLGYSDATLDLAPGDAVDCSIRGAAYGAYREGEASKRPADGGEAVAFAGSFAAQFVEHVNAKREERARDRATREAKARALSEEWASLPLEWRVSESGALVCVPSNAPDYRGPLADSGYSRYDRADLQRYAAAAWVEAEEEIARLKLVKKIAEEAKAKTARAQIRDVLGAKSSDALERFDAGVLPEDELAEIVSEHVFAPLSGFRGYDEITEQEVAHECECDVDDVRFSTTDYGGPLEADEWATLKAIRAAAPHGAKVVVREHVGYQHGHDESDDPEVRRKSIRVTAEFGGRAWKRDFDLGKEHAL